MSAVLNDDYLDMLAALLQAQVEFVLVGAYAMAVHGTARATADINLFVRPSTANAQRVLQALTSFGAPLQAHDVTGEDFAVPGTVYQIGLPPRRIDLLTAIDGVGFDEAIRNAVVTQFGELQVPVIGKAELLRNKRASGRDKDRIDAELLDK